MEINYEITEEDYVKFNIYHNKNSKQAKKLFNILRYLFPVILMAIIFNIGTEGFRQSKIYWAVVAIIFFIYWIIRYPKIYEKDIRKKVQKIIRQEKNKEFIGIRRFVVDENQIKIYTDNRSETIDKASIKDVKFYDDMILIYTSGLTAIILPMRYLNEYSKEELKMQLNII